MSNQQTRVNVGDCERNQKVLDKAVSVLQGRGTGLGRGYEGLTAEGVEGLAWVWCRPKPRSKASHRMGFGQTKG